MTQISTALSGLPVGEKGVHGSLRHLAFLAGGATYAMAKNAPRNTIMSALEAYYSAPNRCRQLWNSLNDAERKLISLYIWSDGSAPGVYAREIASQFGIPRNSKRLQYYGYYNNALAYYKEIYAEDASPIWLLFPGSNHSPLHRELCGLVGKMRRVYSPVEDAGGFVSRENRTADFVGAIRFCNANKLTVTKNGFLSKSSALKLCASCGYDEYAADMDARPQDMRTVQGLLVTLPLTVLCSVGGLLSIREGECVLGGKAMSYIGLPSEQLVKKLFEAYLKSKDFDEISIMAGMRAKRGHHPYEARQNLVEELKYCPVGQAVYTKELEWHLRIASKTFARKGEGYVVTVASNYNYGAEWEQYERPLIYIMLSFFHTLGILDVAWGEANDASDKGRRVPVAFRINPLGAYVLGLSDTYAAPAELSTVAEGNGGFTVLPDYTVVVPDGANRVKHEMFFEKLLTKVSANKEALICKLDFETMVRALDSGAGIASLKQYLAASDKPLPENVLRALEDWEKQSGRIRLRQVTVLECEDAALLEEVIRYKGMGGLVKEKMLAAIVVDGGATKEIKKLIEKNKRFCKNVF